MRFHCSWIAIGFLAAACGRIDYDLNDRVEDPPDAAADPAGPAPLAEPGSLVLEPADISAATSGDGYAMVWAQYPESGTQVQLMFATASAAGEIAVRAALEPLTAPPAFVQVHPTPGGYVVFYRTQSASDLVALTLDASGAVSDRVEDAGASYTRPDVAVTPTGFAVAYLVRVGGVDQVHVRVLDLGGAPVGDPVLVDATGVRQDNPVIHAVGTELAVAWHDFRVSPFRVRYARLDATGVPLGPGVAVHDTGPSQSSPRIAPDGVGGWLLGWSYYSTARAEIDGVRTDVTGAAMWSEPSELIAANGRESINPELASTPRGLIGIVWESDTSSPIPRIDYTSIDVGAGSATTAPPTTLSDARHTGACCAAIARGLSGFGVVYIGDADGTRGLFLTTVEDG